VIHSIDSMPGQLLLIALLGLSVGCGDDSDKRSPDAAAAAAAKASKAEASSSESEETVEPEYVYNPIGKRDPFRTFIATADEEEIRSPTPLQRYELEQYELTGIVWGVDRPRALVEDPEGMGHVIELGTYVGKKWGKVTQITSNQLVVTEEYLTPDGALVVNLIEIKLQYPEEELR
jgi:type IV pilus assembly protein PilP